MKLKLLFTYLFFTLSVFTYAQWERTNVSTFNAETVYGITEHNGELYGAINSKGLIKWNTTTEAWDSVGVTGFTFNDNSVHIELIKSSGNALYAFVAYQTCASTMVFKSEDNGQNFVADTTGLPVYACNNQPGTIHDVFVLDGRLIAIMNTGNYSKMPGDAAWVKNMDGLTEFSEKWGSYNGSWYAWGGYKLNKSSDQGQNWTQPTNTNVPNMFLAKVLNVNPETGRVYVSGSSLTTGQYKMLYSDDEGTSWDSIPIHQALGNSWLGQPQTVLGMISKGDFMELMLVNNANSSHPDVITSADGGQTFQIDTVGLQASAFGTVAVRTMLFYNDVLFMAPNYFDVYRKGGVAKIASSEPVQVKIYPNPVNDVLTIQSNEKLTLVTIIDLQGKQVVSFDHLCDLNHLQLDFLQSGFYLLHATTDNSEATIRLIKK